MHNLAVIGSREYIYQDRVFEYLDKVLEKLGDELMLVSGACPKGPDYFAELWAKKRGVPILLFPADWSKGKSAGFKRNADIIRAADAVVAFWDGKSNGTRDSMERTWTAGKKLLVATPMSRAVTVVRGWEDLIQKVALEGE
jgi:hypothetical protein